MVKSDDSGGDDTTMNNQQAAEGFMNMVEENCDISFTPQVVMAGDDVTDVVSKFKRTVKLGNGLGIENSTKSSGKEVVRVTVRGILRYKPPSNYWVEASTGRYQPLAGDMVIGVVEEKGADWFKININGPAPAILGRLDFDGATK